jgi:hypothetical protein
MVLDPNRTRLARTLRTATVVAAALLPLAAQADEFDTEHIFGFMIGSDVGNVGEREFQSETTGRLDHRPLRQGCRHLSCRRPAIRGRVRSDARLPRRARHDLHGA